MIIDENILNKILIEANEVLKMHHDQLGLIQGVERRFSTRRSNFLNHLRGWDHGEDCEASRLDYLVGRHSQLRASLCSVPYAPRLASLVLALMTMFGIEEKIHTSYRNRIKPQPIYMRDFQKMMMKRELLFIHKSYTSKT